MTITKNIFLGILFSLLLLTNAQAQTADEIIANYFENTGGLENWKKLKSMKIEGKFIQQGMEFPITILSKYPNQMKITIKIQGKQIIQAFDGTTAWAVNPFAMQNEPTKLPEEEQKQAKEDADFEDDFIDYKAKGHTITLEGKETVEGAECFKIKLTKKNGRVDYYFFDTENYVPILEKSEIMSGEGKGGFEEMYHSEYQETGDFMMPYAIVTKVQGQTVMNVKVEKITINPEIEGSEFAFEK